MKKIIKILLGNEDILSKENEDIFLDVNLSQVFNELKPDKFENSFDILKQYTKERNGSKKFMIYGIVDSINDNTNGREISIYREDVAGNNNVDLLVPTNISGDSMTLNSGAECTLVASQISQPLVYNQTNVFNKVRSKFAIALEDLQGTGVAYIRVPGNGSSYVDQIVKLELISYDFEGNQIDYGTTDLIIDDNGQTQEVFNDFPFFYGRHWIKKNVDIGRILPTTVSFVESTYTINEGDVPQIKITLGRPSLFGVETVDINVVRLDTEIEDWSFTGSTISWAIGEQEKTLDFQALRDAGIEPDEQLRLEITNLQFVTLGLRPTTTVTIKDRTALRYATFNLQQIYANRGPFLKTDLVLGAVIPNQDNFAVLRNGHQGFGESLNKEFYEIDEYILSIENLGDETKLPVIPDLNPVEQYWASNQSYDFTIRVKHTVEQLHSQKLVFPSSTPSGNPLLTSNIRIWGRGFFFVSTPTELKDAIDLYEGHKPYTIEISGTEVIITAKNTGINLDIEVNNAPGFDVVLSNVSVIEYAPQIPLQFSLYANKDIATTASYGFTFKQNGYKNVGCASDRVVAGLSPGSQIYYLQSAYSNMRHVYQKKTSSCSIETGTVNWNVISAFVNGVLLLKDDFTSITEPRGIFSQYNTENGVYEPYGPVGQFIAPPPAPITCTNNGQSNNFLGGFNIDPNPELTRTFVDLSFIDIYRQKTKNIDNGFFSYANYTPSTIALPSMNFKYGYIESGDYEFSKFTIKITNLGNIDVDNPFDPGEFINSGDTYEQIIDTSTPNDAEFKPTNGWQLRLAGNAELSSDPLDYKFTKAKYRIVITEYNEKSGVLLSDSLDPTDYVNVSLKDKLNFQIEASGLDTTYENEKLPYFLYTEYDEMNSNYVPLSVIPGFECDAVANNANLIIGRIQGVILGGDYGASDSFMGKPTQLRSFWDRSTLLGTCSVTSCQSCSFADLADSSTIAFLRLANYLD